MAGFSKITGCSFSDTDLSCILNYRYGGMEGRGSGGVGEVSKKSLLLTPEF